MVAVNPPPNGGPAESLTMKLYPGVYTTPFALVGSEFDYVRIVGVDDAGNELDNEFVDVDNLAETLPNLASFEGGKESAANQYIFLRGVNGVTIQNIDFVGARRYAIQMGHTTNSTFSHLRAVDGVAGPAIVMAANSSWNILRMSLLADNQSGVRISDSFSNLVQDNAILGNGQDSSAISPLFGVSIDNKGLSLTKDQGNIILRNRIENNRGTGVFVADAPGTKVEDNIIVANGLDNGTFAGETAQEGVVVTGESHHTTVRKNRIFDNLGSGIRIGSDDSSDASRHIIVSDNDIRDNSAWGIQNLQTVLLLAEGELTNPNPRVEGNQLLRNQAGQYEGTVLDPFERNNVIHVPGELGFPMMLLRVPDDFRDMFDLEQIRDMLDKDNNNFDIKSNRFVPNDFWFLRIESEGQQGSALPFEDFPVVGRNAYLLNGDVVTDKKIIQQAIGGVSFQSPQAEANFSIHFAKLDLDRPQATPMPPRNVHIVQRPNGNARSIEFADPDFIDVHDPDIAAYEIRFQLPLWDTDGNPLVPDDLSAIHVFRATDLAVRNRGDLYKNFVRSVSIEELVATSSTDLPVEERIFTVEDVAPLDSPFDAKVPHLYYLTAVTKQDTDIVVSAAVNVKLARAAAAAPGGRESAFSDTPTPAPVECLRVFEFRGFPGNTYLYWEPVGAPASVHYKIYRTDDPTKLTADGIASLVPIATQYPYVRFVDTVQGDFYYYIVALYSFPNSDDPTKQVTIESEFRELDDVAQHRSTTVEYGGADGPAADLSHKLPRTRYEY